MKVEQRYAIKFCVRLGKTPTETFEMIKGAYLDNSLSRCRVFEWHKKFKDGCESVEDEPRPGRPQTARNDTKIAEINDLIQNDRRIGIKRISDNVNLSYGTTQKIIHEDLEYRKIAARWIPKVMTDEQKANRVTICQQWKRQLQRNPQFLNNVVTCDESWFYHYDPELKSQSMQWKHKGSPRPQKAKTAKSAGKVMHLIFLDKFGIIYDHIVPRGHTVTGEYYSNVLRGPLKAKLKKKRPLYQDFGWKLHHDNAPAHRSMICQRTIEELGVEIMVHPPYSPDLAPCDFHLFPEVKKELRGRRFESDLELNNAVMGILNRLSKNGFSEVYDKWIKRWNKCIQQNGEYFEG